MVIITMRYIQTNTNEITPRRVDVFCLSHSCITPTQSGVFYNLFLPRSEKGNVVNMKSEAQTKRVYHALHIERHSAKDVSTKTVSRRFEGKLICSEGSLS